MNQNKSAVQLKLLLGDHPDILLIRLGGGWDFPSSKKSEINYRNREI